jgi:hypothetical protein
MKHCACRFCLQVLTSEQLIFPVVHGTQYSGYDAREHTHSAVLHRNRGLVRKFLQNLLRHISQRLHREPFIVRQRD